MIEIEKKVRLDEKQLLELSKEGKLLGEKSFMDTYYDTADYKLTTQNIWLRERNSKFELKVPVKVNGRVDSYEEIVDQQTIMQRLGVNGPLSLPCCLKEAQIFPFCTFQTSRRQFLFEGVHIDLDRADFGDGFYTIAELEMVVEKESEAPQALEKIDSLLKRWTINPHQDVPAKISIYLHQKSPHHYEALVNAGVIKMIT